MSHVPAAEIEVVQAVRGLFTPSERSTDGSELRTEPSGIDDSVRGAIDRVTVGKAGIGFRLSEDTSAEGQDSIFIIP